ncbi:unnamed protein product [Acanthoscelides obtectus]|uniref:Uncharacterized protein n=1 Tax=Acanthoscelides obtectus TaxID=200917 RepID=A0A9P0QH55_ACAOB|nr:unnamed protein product [Acanthoscelides obtectus]CAK1680462.1 hypothetical protein AOBTE_LOCUS32672 [Acanthoscelides obtectus]
MSILVGSQSNYFLFRSINKYSSLTSKDKATIRYTERYHGLRYEKGYVDYSLLDEMLRSHLADLDMVYVKRQCKRQFLIDRLNDMQITKPNIINVEDCDSRFKHQHHHHHHHKM